MSHLSSMAVKRRHRYRVHHPPILAFDRHPFDTSFTTEPCFLISHASMSPTALSARKRCANPLPKNRKHVEVWSGFDLPNSCQGGGYGTLQWLRRGCWAKQRRATGL